MSRAVLVLNGREVREKATRWCNSAPAGTRVEFKETKRSIPQNDKMWVCLTAIEGQATYHGMKLTRNEWKLLFLDALEREMRIVPNLAGNGFVNLRQASSDLSKSEMSDLFHIIQGWSAAHGILLGDEVSA